MKFTNSNYLNRKEIIPMSILVFGHKNPDTDSICSSIAYANLKEL